MLGSGGWRSRTAIVSVWSLVAVASHADRNPKGVATFLEAGSHGTMKSFSSRHAAVFRCHQTHRESFALTGASCLCNLFQFDCAL